MAPQRVSHDCRLTPEAVWAMRDDHGFDVHCATADKNVHEVLSLVEAGDGTITRRSRITALENPIPPAFRNMLGVGEQFSFEITEVWRRDKYDESSPMRFTTTPAVMADKVDVRGAQWVEAHGGGSTLFFELDVNVSIFGVGGAVAKGIQEGTVAAYASLPRRLAEYARGETATVATSEGDGMLGGLAKALASGVVGTAVHCAIKLQRRVRQRLRRGTEWRAKQLTWTGAAVPLLVRVEAGTVRTIRLADSREMGRVALADVLSVELRGGREIVLHALGHGCCGLVLRTQLRLSVASAAAAAALCTAVRAAMVNAPLALVAARADVAVAAARADAAAAEASAAAERAATRAALLRIVELQHEKAAMAVELSTRESTIQEARA
jgi:hypothetical protein